MPAAQVLPEKTFQGIHVMGKESNSLLPKRNLEIHIVVQNYAQKLNEVFSKITSCQEVQQSSPLLMIENHTGLTCGFPLPTINSGKACSLSEGNNYVIPRVPRGVDVVLYDNGVTPRRLEGKIAIVTGGAKGIGEATVRLFTRHGAKVVIADVEDMLGTTLANSLSPSSTYIHCDVSMEEDIENLIESTISRYGRLDILINNAGVLGNQSKHKSIVDFDTDEFDRVMNVNVRGVALGMKHAARAMIPRGGGCIISMASVAGVMGGLGPHAYTASKHAIVGLTKNTACELGRYGIRVNCISPFGVATSMLVSAWKSSDEEEENCMTFGAPSVEEVEKMEDFVRGLANLKGPTLRTKDIAEAALYLASDESKYISGHNLVVDGGITTSRNCVGL